MNNKINWYGILCVLLWLGLGMAFICYQANFYLNYNVSNHDVSLLSEGEGLRWLAAPWWRILLSGLLLLIAVFEWLYYLLKIPQMQNRAGLFVCYPIRNLRPDGVLRWPAALLNVALTIMAVITVWKIGGIVLDMVHDIDRCIAYAREREFALGSGYCYNRQEEFFVRFLLWSAVPALINVVVFCSQWDVVNENCMRDYQR